MPAFTFEKISPPRHLAHAAHSQPLSQSEPLHSEPLHSAPSQQRDSVIQVLGRFVIARVRDDQASPDHK